MAPSAPATYKPAMKKALIIENAAAIAIVDHPSPAVVIRDRRTGSNLPTMERPPWIAPETIQEPFGGNQPMDDDNRYQFGYPAEADARESPGPRRSKMVSEYRSPASAGSVGMCPPVRGPESGGAV